MNFDINTVINYGVGFFWGLLSFIAIFIPAVCIHEFGHLLMAKLCGVRVPEYAVGMPYTKRWFWFKKFGIVWAFYPILMGGFVRLYGDSDAIDNAFDDNKTDPKIARVNYIGSRFEEIIISQMLQFFLEDNSVEYTEKWKAFESSEFAKSNGEKDQTEANLKLKKQIDTLIDWEFDKEMKAKDTFFSKNWFQQTLIIVGGVVFNTITAIICFALLFQFSGALGTKTLSPAEDIPRLEQRANVKSISEYAIISVGKNGLADKNGFKSGDKVYTFAGVKANDIKNIDEFRTILNNNKDQDVDIEYSEEKSTDKLTKKVKLIPNENGKVFFGINGGLLREVSYESKGIGESLSFGTETTFDYIKASFGAFGKIGEALLPQTKDRSALDGVGGPIKVSEFAGDIIKKFDVSQYLRFLALISISLAVFNILPIPALDGGRWLILTAIKIVGKRNRRIENMLIGYTFLFLMGLGVVIAFKDTWQIFNK
jgi:regulator of sigma E protease